MEIVIDILGGITLVFLIVWAVCAMIDFVSRAIKRVRKKGVDKNYHNFADTVAAILEDAGNGISKYEYRGYQELVFFIADRIKRVGYISGGELRSRVDKIIEQLNKESND